MSMVAATRGMTLLLFVVSPSSVSSLDCTTTALSTSMTPCITSMMSASGSACEKWDSAVCCLKDQFTSCAPEFSSTIDQQLSTMGTLFSTMGLGDTSSCSTPSCTGGTRAGGSTAPKTGGTGVSVTGGSTAQKTPVAVQQVIETMIEFANNVDPTTFNLTSYLEVVRSQTGGTLPDAAIKAWDTILTYAVPPETTDTQLRAAIAAAMEIAEDVITILTGGARRLTTQRRLTANKQVSISATDATKAKEYKDKSSSTATTDKLTSTLGSAVSVATPPVTKMKLETKVTSTKTKSELETELKSSTIATAVGGSISSVQSPQGTASSGAFRSGMMVVTSIVVAVVVGSV